VKWLRTRSVEFLDHAKALIRHLPDFFDRRLEPCELVAEVVDGRLNPIANAFAGVGKEEVTRRRTNERTDHRTRHQYSRIVHTSSLPLTYHWLPKRVPVSASRH